MASWFFAVVTVTFVPLMILSPLAPFLSLFGIIAISAALIIDAIVSSNAKIVAHLERANTIADMARKEAAARQLA